MGKYYPNNYWKMPGIFGTTKDFIYDFFQSRRPKWLKTYLKKGSVLDIGAGEANFAQKMTGYEMTSLDFPGSKIKNPNVIKVDFPKWNTGKKFDAIVFWESLEHVSDAGKYLEKAYKLLKAGGFIFIECPRFNSLEAKLFGSNWYHLDPPRHLIHFSDKGLEQILKNLGFKLILSQSVFTPEYAYLGFLAGLLKSGGLSPMDSYIKRSNLPLHLFFATLLSPFAIIAESFLFLLGESPIMLTVARKPK